MLWTKMMFSLLLTKSMTDLVEWLQGKVGKKQDYYRYKHFSHYLFNYLIYCGVFKKAFIGCI